MEKYSELICKICGRNIPGKACSMKHHLTPRSLKGKETIIVCRPCGSQIHKIFSLREMQKKYHTLDTIFSDERMQKWIKWIRKTDHWKVCMKAKKKRK